MYQLVIAHRACSMVRETIHPFVHHSETRLGRQVICSSDRFSLGFISKLATLIALDRYPNLSSDGLGHVQTATICFFSMENEAAIGEEISFLSLTSEQLFNEGLYSAVDFYSYISFRKISLYEDIFVDIAQSKSSRADILRCWEAKFERPIDDRSF